MVSLCLNRLLGEFVLALFFPDFSVVICQNTMDVLSGLTGGLVPVHSFLSAPIPNTL